MNNQLQQTIKNVIKALEMKKQFKGNNTSITIQDSEEDSNTIEITCNCYVNTTQLYNLIDVLSSLNINFSGNLYGSTSIDIDKQYIDNAINKLNRYIKTNYNKIVELNNTLSKAIEQNYHDLQNFKIIRITIPRVNESDYNDTINKFKNYQFQLSKDLTKLYIHKKLE